MNPNTLSNSHHLSQTDIKRLFKLVMNQVQFRTTPISIEKKRQRQQARSQRVRPPPPYSPKNFRTRTINPAK
jgi:hypothetical protein